MKAWLAGEVLFASDLNDEFDNVLENPISLLSPLTADLDFDGFDVDDVGEIEFRDESGDPTADGRLRRSGDELTLRMQDARTNTVARPWAIWADTTGTPAASLGVGMLFQGESQDENPSDFGALDFVASDIGTGSEDTYLSVLLRVAGGALDEKYRFQSTAGSGFTAIFDHAVTADRTYTLPDKSGTVAMTSDASPAATQAEMEAASSTTVAVTPGRAQYHPSATKVWVRGLNTTIQSSYNVTSLTDNGTGNWTVNFTTAFSSTANSSHLANAQSSSALFAHTLGAGTGSIDLNVRNDAGALTDPDQFVVAVYGDQ